MMSDSRTGGGAQDALELLKVIKHQHHTVRRAHRNQLGVHRQTVGQPDITSRGIAADLLRDIFHQIDLHPAPFTKHMRNPERSLSLWGYQTKGAGPVHPHAHASTPGIP